MKVKFVKEKEIHMWTETEANEPKKSKDNRKEFQVLKFDVDFGEYENGEPYGKELMSNNLTQEVIKTILKKIVFGMNNENNLDGDIVNIHLTRGTTYACKHCKVYMTFIGKSCADIENIYSADISWKVINLNTGEAVLTVDFPSKVINDNSDFGIEIETLVSQLTSTSNSTSCERSAEVKEAEDEGENWGMYIGEAIELKHLLEAIELKQLFEEAET